ncbi:Asp/Glu/Hydantoin racemase [compost metagenome]
MVLVKALEAGLAAVREDGAQALLLGCTGFMGVAERLSRLLEQDLGCYVPVLDPNQCGFSFLLSLVRMGLRPSRLCYSKASLG